MSFFVKLEGEACILATNGVFKHADIYAHDDLLFAAFGSGYIGLCADGSTTKDKTRVYSFPTEMKICRTKLGRLCTIERNEAIVLEEAKTLKLTNGVK